MKINQLKIVATLIIFATITNFALGQNISSKENKDRFITIDNLSDYFKTRDDGSIYIEFTIHNIFENESSKPLHEAVNEIPNVIKFSIRANSENFENQRMCFLNIMPQSYKDTYITALKAMNIKFVDYQGELISIDDFYSIIK